MYDHGLRLVDGNVIGDNVVLVAVKGVVEGDFVSANYSL